LEELKKILEIDNELSQSIIDCRKIHEKFNKSEDIKLVDGIDEKKGKI
jgi:DNA uptake protein ComE-like DNA-binding protein